MIKLKRDKIMGMVVKKILYLDHAPYLSGAERSLRLLVTHLDQSRYQPIVVTPDHGDFAQELHKHQIEVIPFNFWSWQRLFLLLPVLLDLVRLVVLVKKHRPDLIHGNSRFASMFSYPVSILTGVPAVNQVRDMDPLSSVRLRLLSNVEKLIAISNGVKRWLIESGVSEEKIVVVHNGMEIEKPKVKSHPSFAKVADAPKLWRWSATEGAPRSFSEVGQISKSQLKTQKYKELNLRAQSLIVGTIAQVYPRKGIDILIRGFAQAAVEINDLHLLIIGGDKSSDQRYLKEYQQLVQDLGIEKKVHFLGFRSDTKELLSVIDVFVLASRREPFGIVLLEAMLAGVPVIGSAVDGIVEIVKDNEVGFLIKPDNSSLLAKKLKTLLQDQTLRDKMGGKGREHVIKHFSIEKTAREVEKVYQTVMKI